jgi:hypothetical protein
MVIISIDLYVSIGKANGQINLCIDRYMSETRVLVLYNLQ